MKFATIALIGAVQACDVTVKVFTDDACTTESTDAAMKDLADGLSTAFSTAVTCVKTLDKDAAAAAYPGQFADDTVLYTGVACTETGYTGGMFTDAECTTAATPFDKAKLKAKTDAESDKTKFDTPEKLAEWAAA